jgi:transposase InsO family protein
MDLQDAGCHARCLIRDRDGKFPGLFDTILADAGTEVVLSGIRIPRMNSIMERWVQNCRRELLDRALIRNQRHLLRALREFEQFSNAHRPHQGIANARPLHPLPEPITDHRSPIRTKSPASAYIEPTDSAASFTSTSMLRDQAG